MANAWAGHFEKEAMSNKMIYDQVSQAFREHERQWNSLNLQTAHWVDIADNIRWANAMAHQSFDTGYAYFINMIEHLKSGNPFTAKKRMEAFGAANKDMADWTRAAVAKWDKLANDYGVTLIDYSNEAIEIALMADAAMYDIHRYIGSKWDASEAELLIKKVRDKFEVSDQEYESWKVARKLN